MNKARFEAIEAERLSDPMKFAIHANVYWMEALPVLRFHFEPKPEVKEPLVKAPKAEVKEPVFLENGAANKRAKVWKRKS